jgi:hypothetical protein
MHQAQERSRQVGERLSVRHHLVEMSLARDLLALRVGPEFRS